MDIVIIGSGNAAAVLGRKFRQAGHNILQVLSRNASAASALAYEWDSESANYKTLVNPNADVYIIAVTDDAIDDVAADLKLTGKVVAHTAAAVPMNILKNVSEHHGVFYPLQTLRKENSSLPDFHVFFDGTDQKTRSTLEKLARSISGEMVIRAGDEDRLKMHIAAVIVSNFTNHLYALAEKYCREEGISFASLYPLIIETANRVAGLSPEKIQTGPAIRHDDETLEKHIELLSKHPQLQKLYIQFTESIQKFKG